MSEPGSGGARNAIAIVGMAGRFPGAADVDELWRNLRAGVESIVSFSDEELAAAGVDRETYSQPNYVRARAPLDGVELFENEELGVGELGEGLIFDDLDKEAQEPVGKAQTEGEKVALVEGFGELWELG